MSLLRMRITLNKGKRGIALDKLENIVEELRKFFVGVGNDMELTEPTSWVGVDFRNSSLEFTTEYQVSVDTAKLARFNGALMTLARSEFPPSFDPATSQHFFEVAGLLEPDEVAEIAVFNEDNTIIPLEIGRRTATLARFIDVLPFRESIGAIQGKIHSLYKESRPQHFVLRELSTDNLIKCIYELDDYPAIVKALEVKEQVLHVRGLVVTDTRKRNIEHIRVQRILLADEFGIEDVDKFLRIGRTQ